MNSSGQRRALSTRYLHTAFIRQMIDNHKPQIVRRKHVLVTWVSETHDEFHSSSGEVQTSSLYSRLKARGIKAQNRCRLPNL